MLLCSFNKICLLFPHTHTHLSCGESMLTAHFHDRSWSYGRGDVSSFCLQENLNQAQSLPPRWRWPLVTSHPPGYFLFVNVVFILSAGSVCFNSALFASPRLRPPTTLTVMQIVSQAFILNILIQQRNCGRPFLLVKNKQIHKSKSLAQEMFSIVNIYAQHTFSHLEKGSDSKDRTFLFSPKHIGKKELP